MGQETTEKTGHAELLAACRETLAQMEDLYDGAPDSTTLWMGRHIERLRAVIARATGEGE